MFTSQTVYTYDIIVQVLTFLHLLVSIYGIYTLKQ